MMKVPLRDLYMGVSENRGPSYSISNSRILTIRTPFSETPISIMQY